jgi:hypothetical protein
LVFDPFHWVFWGGRERKERKERKKREIMATNAQILVSTCISVIKYSFGSMTGRNPSKKGNSQTLVLKYDLLQVQKTSAKSENIPTESFRPW